MSVLASNQGEVLPDEEKPDLNVSRPACSRPILSVLLPSDLLSARSRLLLPSSHPISPCQSPPSSAPIFLSNVDDISFEGFYSLSVRGIFIQQLLEIQIQLAALEIGAVRARRPPKSPRRSDAVETHLALSPDPVSACCPSVSRFLQLAVRRCAAVWWSLPLGKKVEHHITVLQQRTKLGTPSASFGTPTEHEISVHPQLGASTAICFWYSDLHVPVGQSVILGWQSLQQSYPLMALPSAGTAGSEDVLGRSYASVVFNPVDNPSFKIPLQFPVDIHGKLGFVFSKTEMTKVAEEYKFAIVMKFLRVRPSIDVIRLKVVKKWGLIEIPIISFMDDFHVLIQMKNERDFMHGWAREGRVMVGTDNATLTRSRATGARICVEIDLTAEAVKGFPIVVSPTKCIWKEGHTTVVCRVGERSKEVGKPKENITWQQKKFDINGTSSGTKDDKEMEANTTSLSERPQDLVHILENEKDVSEEECDEVCCDKGNEVASKFMQLKDKESSESTKNLTDEMENVLAEHRLSGDSSMGYCSSQEEGEVLVLRGKEKAYDSEGANRSDAGKCKKITSDKTVRKSKRFHTRTQKLNL
ncbi:hypothetical protein ACLOJK_003177 [Asimina triloba]